MSEAFVFTYKDGLLSPLAHDLQLKVTRFEVTDRGASFDASSLKVHSAGGPLPKTFYAEIEKNIREAVLRSSRYPLITFEATQVGPKEIAGKLTLCGVTKPIVARRRGDVVEYDLHQPDFGITPYTAMLGTLKVKPFVKVRVTL